MIAGQFSLEIRCVVTFLNCFILLFVCSGMEKFQEVLKFLILAALDFLFMIDKINSFCCLFSIFPNLFSAAMHSRVVSFTLGTEIVLIKEPSVSFPVLDSTSFSSLYVHAFLIRVPFGGWPL